ncbi:hypothetical protein AYM40_22850 [Paraburkholderia phytofirmans OLGA172]|uniref:Uncharacterized protein n=1 Tax=Paraburkholderia phytofirmans OLGA172 TaxID=1417228 RepID=A0A167WAA2_9BURK|nr:hypothetical protein AYM40_22850 [Paraburkholderia phytofirmans OLGA172]
MEVAHTRVSNDAFAACGSRNAPSAATYANAPQPMRPTRDVVGPHVAHDKINALVHAHPDRLIMLAYAVDMFAAMHRQITRLAPDDSVNRLRLRLSLS